MVILVKEFFWSDVYFKRYKIFIVNFQELISHWLLTFHSNGLQHHRGLGLSFPKWCNNCICKNGCTVDQNLRSCIFGQNLYKTSGGYLGLLKPFFGATKGTDGCPLMGTQGFWRQKPIWRTSFYEYQTPPHCILCCEVGVH